MFCRFAISSYVRAIGGGLLVTAAAVALAGPADASVLKAAPVASASLVKDARWVTLNGRRQLVAPVSAQAAKAATAHAASGIPWGTLKNAGTGMCLSAYPDVVGQPAEQRPCNNSYNQHWVLIHNGPGWSLENEGMIVKNSPNGPVNGCLDNRGGEVYANGNPQIMWPCYDHGWNWGLDYGLGIAQTKGTQLIHTNGFRSSNGKTWCVTTYPGTTPGTPISEWVCSKYAPNQSFYGTVTH